MSTFIWDISGISKCPKACNVPKFVVLHSGSCCVGSLMQLSVVFSHKCLILYENVKKQKQIFSGSNDNLVIYVTIHSASEWFSIAVLFHSKTF